MNEIDKTYVRRKTRQIWVGSVPIGGDAPISVQSMTNTQTCDVAATVDQIRRLVEAGADLVRISVPTMEAAEAVGRIRQLVKIPVIADIHFDHKIALRVAALGVDCLRINPGNIGRDDKVREVIACARDRGIPIRIGVNAGSLEKALQRKYGEPCADALVESAWRHIDLLNKHDFHNFKISLKASNVWMTVAAYQKIASQIDQPLHMGVTEAGVARAGSIKSSMALGALLMQGIGDTIRVSLAADPVEEIKVGFEILKGLGLRKRGINLIACPSCSRQNFDVIRTVNELEARLDDIQEDLDVAVIGCIVNGPGEAKVADLGVTGGTPNNLIYRDGKPFQKATPEQLLDMLEQQVREKLAQQRVARGAESTKGETRERLSDACSDDA
ncbi:MAG: flavodoxin-dependent (E)-4-hydroxy-3-methylbut-2-enyl-diphosphate synthase [Gammaproteobacteria bacterium]